MTDKLKQISKHIALSVEGILPQRHSMTINSAIDLRPHDFHPHGQKLSATLKIGTTLVVDGRCNQVDVVKRATSILKNELYKDIRHALHDIKSEMLREDNHRMKSFDMLMGLIGEIE